MKHDNRTLPLSLGSAAGGTIKGETYAENARNWDYIFFK
jgi:hypothetical protein